MRCYPRILIAGGLLSGRHNRNLALDRESRFALGTAVDLYRDRYWYDREFDTVDRLVRAAHQGSVPLVTLAMAWVLANPAVTSPIGGASKPEQLDAALEATTYILDPRGESQA